jgi:hypothetical protein
LLIQIRNHHLCTLRCPYYFVVLLTVAVIASVDLFVVMQELLSVAAQLSELAQLADLPY